MYCSSSVRKTPPIREVVERLRVGRAEEDSERTVPSNSVPHVQEASPCVATTSATIFALDQHNHMEHDAEIGKKQDKRSRMNAALRRRPNESASSNF